MLMSPQFASVEDLRHRARRRLPLALFDYVDGGADGEVTMRANAAAFDAVELRPRMGQVFQGRQLGTTVLGHELSMPIMLGRCGFIGLMHPDGEAGAARAAAKVGSIFVASTLSLQPIEEIAQAAPGRTWLQLYLVGGREAAERLILRARACGIGVLVVTLDTTTAGYRERDVRNGVPLLTAPGPLWPGLLIWGSSCRGRAGFPVISAPGGHCRFRTSSAARVAPLASQKSDPSCRGLPSSGRTSSG